MSEGKGDCTRCGACLKSCAVYQLLLEEPASPRGRLATLNALREGRLKDTPANRRFIDACMLCGRCEAACQRGVKVRDEVLALRRIWRAAGRGPWWKRALTRFYGPRTLRLARPFLRLLSLTPLRRKLMIPAVDKGENRRKRREGIRTSRPSAVFLFPGCVLGVFYPRFLTQMTEMLRGSGIEVEVLWEADCCGFPAISQGDLASFENKKKKNELIFAKRGVKTLLLPCATGLMAMRAHYREDLLLEDLGAYLLDILPRPSIRNRLVLDAPPGYWLFHRPCHQPKRDEKSGWLKVLSDCPQIRMPPREETDCCGFGGLFSIGFPTVSRGILAERQRIWKGRGFGGIITDCPGCYMQFRSVGDMPVLFFSELFFPMNGSAGKESVPSRPTEFPGY